jgi:phage baseplate assembly protein W
MASLNFNVLSKPNVTDTKFTYSDIHLDFNEPIKRDVKADYDEAAIKNSLVNLFNTLPGQNLLNPEYGLNLLQYLFTPASESIANLIGQNILKQIGRHEPRVTVSNVNVEVNSDEQTYIITLSIIILPLNKNINIYGLLTQNGFSLLK